MFVDPEIYATQSHNKARRDTSGLPDLNMYDRRGDKERYAKHLIKYISDPSTVRVRVLEMYGKPALKISAINEWRKKLLKDAASPFPVQKQQEKERKPEIVEPTPMLEVAPPKAAPPVTPQEHANEIIQQIADKFKITFGELVGSMTHRHYMHARSMACVILYARYGNYTQVAIRLRRKDHSSIISAVRVFFEKYINVPHVMDAWMELAPPEIREVRSVAEFLRTV